MRCLLVIALVACHASPPAPSATPSAGEQRAVVTRNALVGHRAPAATLTLLDGTRVALAGLGKPVYLKFWATWCKPCREQMPHLEAAYEHHGDKVAIYAVAMGLNDPLETVKAFVAEQKLHMPIAFDADGSLGDAFQLSVTPLHVLIDRSGVIRYVGHEASPELDAALAALPDATGAPAVAATAPAAADLPTGKPLALTFVATWCDTYLDKTRPAMAEACAAHAREVARLQQAHPELTWVVVAHPDWTDPEDLGEFTKKFGTRGTIQLDSGAWFARFHVRDVATTILLDATGAERARIGGRGDGLADAIAKMREPT